MASKLLMTFDKVLSDPSGRHTDFKVTKDADDVYQQWANYPDSPETSENYPYQLIATNTSNGATILVMSTTKLYSVGETIYSTSTPRKYCSIANGAWNNVNQTSEGLNLNIIHEANYDVYTGQGYTVVYFEKTTTEEQDANAIELTPTAIALNSEDHKIAELSIAESIEYGDIIKLAYTKGMVHTPEIGWLASFTNHEVTNQVPVPYQEWASFPDSPILTPDYPYQAIINFAWADNLVYSATPMYYNSATERINNVSGNIIYRAYSGGNWSATTYSNDYFDLGGGGVTFKEANSPVYTDSTLNTVYFAKTTP